MQQLLNVWKRMDLRRQIIVVGATVAMFLAILTMSRLATSPSMALLYNGLESGAAGEVVRALEQRDVAFEVRGGAIYVDSRRRDELRLTLASEGLPANSTQGYELLDSLNGFGTTSQMFDAAYWRAKEGELARTIVSSPHVAMARVHIASSHVTPFQRGVTPTASVAITPNGGTLTAAQAKAIRFLVASAVAGLAPEDVSVIDGNGQLLGSSDEKHPPLHGEERAAMLRDRVTRLLEARVGPGNAVVEVSVETVTETEEIRERRFDPESRIAISTDTQETTNNSNETGAGSVTVASNLPEGDQADGENTTRQSSETRERINYEVSETEREIVRAPGAIKRLTVAVLIDDREGVENGEETFRSEDELLAMRDLVASAVGFNENRGDVITIKAMALRPIVPSGVVATRSFLGGFTLDLMSLIQMVVLATVTLVLGLFVLRPLLTRPPRIEPGPGPMQLPAADTNETDVSGARILADRQMQVLPADLPDALPRTSSASLEQQAVSDPVDRLRAMIDDRQEETVEILRSWLEAREENAG